MSSEQLQSVLEAYVLADSPTERKKLRDNLIPGSETQLYLQLLDTFKSLQENPSDPIPKDLQVNIETYARKYSNGSQMFKLREKLLRYDRANETERKNILDEIARNELHLTSAWNFRPPAVKKVVGQEQEKQKLPSKADDSLIPSKSELVKKLHSNRSNFTSVDQCFLGLIDFAKLDDTRFNQFCSSRQMDFAILAGNKTFIPRLAAFLDKECHRNKSYYTDASTVHLEGLTLQQLRELGKQASFLRTEDRNFVGVEFSKQFAEWLVPGASDNFTLKEQREHLLEMYEAAKKLPPKFKSLKSSMLVEILRNGVAMNVYDFKLFLDYLAFPTVSGIVKNSQSRDYHWDQYLSNVQRANHAPARHADNSGKLQGGDQDLIEIQLIHFFNEEFERETKGQKSEGHLKQLKDHLSEDFLSRVYDECRLKAGLTLEESSKSTTHIYERVQREVTLKLCDYNPALFMPNEEVVLDLEVKNIQQLYVKVFEINTENYYRKHMAPFRTDVNLDGLLSSYEQIHRYDDPPAHSRIRTFRFPELPNRVGLFVIEFIGKGVSSRAVIKKGSLSLIQKPTSFGHQAFILDENKDVLRGEGVSIFLDGEDYKADEEGRVVIPYARNQHSSTAILRSPSGFAQIADFYRLSENYELKCSTVLLPESLIMGSKAQIMLVPHLLCNGRSASLTILKKISATLHIHTQHASVPTTQTFHDLKLDNAKELLLEFTVPPLLTQVSINFQAEVFNLSLKQRQPLSYSDSMSVNLHTGDFLFQELYLSRPQEGYQIQVRGKNGEPKAGVVVQVNLTLDTYADGNQSINRQFATDEDGKIHLGKLKGVSSLSANSKTNRTWTLPSPQASLQYPTTIDILEKEPIELPFLSKLLDPNSAVLVKVHPSTYGAIQDKSEHLRREERASANYDALFIEGLAAGRYRLTLPQNKTDIAIVVHRGQYWGEDGGFIQIRDRILQNQLKPSFLKIAEVKADQESVKVSLEGGKQDKSARVHIFAFHFLPPDLERLILNLRGSQSQNFSTTEFPFAMWKNFFLSNRALGDQYRYVFDRKSLPRFVGNTLDKPKMIVKRNYIQDTTFAEQQISQGASYESYQQAMPQASMMNMVPQQRAMPAMRQQAMPMMMQQSIPYSNVMDATSNMIPTIGYGGDPFTNFSSMNYAVPSSGGINGFQNFLQNSAFAAYNLKPDEKGVVNIKTNLSSYNGVLVIALDSSSVTHQYSPLKKGALKTRRLDLLKPLHPDQAFTEVREVAKLAKHDSFVVDDLQSSKLQIVDSLSKVGQFLIAINSEGTTKKNAEDFKLLQWDRLSREDKDRRFTKYFSHELNLFICAKDPQYFKEAVLPLVRCKCEKTLVDYFLLGDKEALEKYLNPEIVYTLQPLEIVLLIALFAKDRTEDCEAMASLLRAQGERVKPSIDERNATFDAVIEIDALAEPTGLKGMIQEERAAYDIVEEEAKIQADLYAADEVEGLDMLGGAGFSSGGAMQMMARQEANIMSHSMAMRNVAPRSAPLSIASRMKSKKAPRMMNFNAAPPMASMAANIRPEYEELQEVKQYAETHFYGVKYLSEMGSRTRHSQFWGDVATQFLSTSKGDGSIPAGFLSEHFVQAVSSFTELCAALAFLDIPWTSADHGFKTNAERGAEIKAASNLMVFSKDLRQTNKDIENNLIVTLRLSEAGASVSKDPAKMPELLIDEAYTAHIVVTNVSPEKQEAQLLMQIPEGAIPLRETPYHKATPVQLHPYQNSQFTMHFYFPRPGTFLQSPVSLSVKSERVVAQSAALQFKVVPALSSPSLETFRDIIATGDNEAILRFMREEDIVGEHMGYHVRELYFLMKQDRGFWLKAIDILRKRKCFDRIAWSLGFFHGDAQTLKEFLNNEKSFKKRFGAHFRSGLLAINPPDTDWRLLDYHPLVNKRAHPLGRNKDLFGDGKKGGTILNHQFASFYRSFVNVLAEKPFPIHTYDRLNLVYYLLLQDRVDEALNQFSQVDPAHAREAAPVQYDYMSAYLDFYTGQGANYAVARSIVKRYESYPAISWRLLFDDVRTQLQELDGEEATPDVPDTEEKLIEERRAAAHRRGIDLVPQLSVTAEGRKLLIESANVKEVTIKYYPVDLELLFSREPFLTLKSGASTSGDNDFSYVKPAEVETVEAVDGLLEHKVSENMQKNNMVIEVLAGARKELITFFASSLLRVTLVESYGEIKVADSRSGKPLSQVYVKVFAQKGSGHSFHKDGYTDIRGRFDYASLSSSSGLKDVSKFAILVASDELGSLTREAKPPAGTGKRADKI